MSALSKLSHPDSVEFLASLLPGRNTPVDDLIKLHAIRGLRCVGTEAARDAILDGIRSWTDLEQRLTWACSALRELTHYEWCDVELLFDAMYPRRDDIQVRRAIETTQSRWRKWWPANRTRARIYKPEDDYPGPDLPKIWQ